MSEFGLILEVRFPEHKPRAHEQEGLSPCLLILDTGRLQSVAFPQLWVAPITSTHLESGATRVQLNNGDGDLELGGTLMLDQMRAIDVSRMRGQFGRIQGTKLEEIRSALVDIFQLILH